MFISIFYSVSFLHSLIFISTYPYRYIQLVVVVFFFSYLIHLFICLYLLRFTVINTSIGISLPLSLDSIIIVFHPQYSL